MQSFLKKYILIIQLILCLSASSLQAQQNHFLFVQTESRTPFNITLNNKVYSSTATGYLIIPKLATGQYGIVVGFGGNTLPDQHFTIQIARKDVGFSLKDFENKGWGLFNLQSFETTMSLESRGSNTVASTSQSNLSAEVEGKTETEKKSVKVFQPEVNRPVIEEEKAVTAEKKGDFKSDTIESVVVATVIEPIAGPKADKVERTEAVKTPAQQPSATENKPGYTEQVPVQKKEETNPPKKISTSTLEETGNSAIQADNKVIKISELKGSEAIYLTYVDYYSVGNDTVNILIPDPKNAAPKTVTEKPKSKLNFLDMNLGKNPETTEPIVKIDAAKAETDVSIASNNDQINNEKVNNEKVASEKVNSEKINTEKVNSEKLNTNCNTIASDDDFFKLRKKMAAAVDNEGMLLEAKKVFKNICFSTEQVKNLAYLFLSDQARYQFFDIAYPFVSDSEKFSSLSIMLSDTYYINRFKAMLY